MVGLGALFKPSRSSPRRSCRRARRRRCPRPDASARTGRRARPCGCARRSMWQLARISTPSSTTTPGPKNTLGSMVTSRPICVSKLNHTVSGAISVAPACMARERARRWNTASAAASCSRELTPIASSSEHTTGRVAQSVLGSERDRIGQVVFALGVGIADARQQPGEIGDAERHRARIAQPDAPLGLARIVVLADGGDAPFAVDDQPAVACCIGRLEARARRCRHPPAAPRRACAASPPRPAAYRRTAPSRRPCAAPAPAAPPARHRPCRPGWPARRSRCRVPRPSPRRAPPPCRAPPPAPAAPAPASWAVASTCASIERPPMRCSTFGRSERMRTPLPAARTMIRSGCVLIARSMCCSYPIPAISAADRGPVEPDNALSLQTINLARLGLSRRLPAKLWHFEHTSTTRVGQPGHPR